MTKILFVCLGNICRSPMAELTFRELARQAGLEGQVYVESAGTSDEEYGNPVYPPVRRLLAQHGISADGKYARQMDRGDYDRFDLLIAMEQSNLNQMRRICGGDPAGKMSLLLSHAGRSGGVADPWYTRDFEAAWRDILQGCTALLETVRRREAAKD